MNIVGMYTVEPFEITEEMIDRATEAMVDVLCPGWAHPLQDNEREAARAAVVAALGQEKP